MALFSQKIRRVLRKVYLVVGVSTISLMFQACYGMPMAPCTPPCEDDCELCAMRTPEKEPSQDEDSDVK